MSYQDLRTFADSWGLLLMTLAFLTFVGWTFLPSARRSHERAQNSIFEEDGTNG
jgi:cytochrome c oxidase cbb3-type subunit 4